MFPVVPTTVRPPARTMLEPVVNATPRVVGVGKRRRLSRTSRWVELPADAPTSVLVDVADVAAGPADDVAGVDSTLLARVTDGTDPQPAVTATRHAIAPSRRDTVDIELDRGTGLEDADRQRVNPVGIG
jgi:hypothetical protein